MRARGLAGLSILVVEDDRDNREMFEQYLGDHLGATVRTAVTAEDAVEQFKAGPAAVVLADISLPGRDGLWLSQEIRSLPGASRVPFITITGRTLPQERLLSARGIEPMASWERKPQRINDALRAALQCTHALRAARRRRHSSISAGSSRDRSV